MIADLGDGVGLFVHGQRLGDGQLGQAADESELLRDRDRLSVAAQQIGDLVLRVQTVAIPFESEFAFVAACGVRPADIPVGNVGRSYTGNCASECGLFDRKIDGRGKSREHISADLEVFPLCCYEHRFDIGHAAECRSGKFGDAIFDCGFSHTVDDGAGGQFDIFFGAVDKALDDRLVLAVVVDQDEIVIADRLDVDDVEIFVVARNTTRSSCPENRVTVPVGIELIPRGIPSSVALRLTIDDQRLDYIFVIDPVPSCRIRFKRFIVH